MQRVHFPRFSWILGGKFHPDSLVASRRNHQKKRYLRWFARRFSPLWPSENQARRRASASSAAYYSAVVLPRSSSPLFVHGSPQAHTHSSLHHSPNRPFGACEPPGKLVEEMLKLHCIMFLFGDVLSAAWRQYLPLTCKSPLVLFL